MRRGEVGSQGRKSGKHGTAGIQLAHPRGDFPQDKTHVLHIEDSARGTLGHGELCFPTASLCDLGGG